MVDAVEGIDRIRYTSPHPKDMREDVVRAHVELRVAVRAHPPAAAGRLVAGAQGHAPHLRPRALHGPRGHDPRSRARRGADHRHHRRLPGRDRGRVRRDAGGGRGGGLRLGVHLHLLAPARHHRRRAARPAAARGQARAHGAAGRGRPAARHERSQRFVGRTMEVLVEGTVAHRPGRACAGARGTTRRVHFAGPGRARATWSRSRSSRPPARRWPGPSACSHASPSDRGRAGDRHLRPHRGRQDRAGAGAGRPSARAGRGPRGHLGRRAPGLPRPGDPDRGAHAGRARAPGAPAGGLRAAGPRSTRPGRYMERAHAEIDAALAAGRTPDRGGRHRALPARGAGRAGPGAGTRRRELRARLEARGPRRRCTPSWPTRVPSWPRRSTRATASAWCARWSCWRWGTTPPRPGDDSQLWTADTRHPTLLVGLTMEREALYARHRRARGRDGGRGRGGRGAPGRGRAGSRAPPARRWASTSCWPATWRP